MKTLDEQHLNRAEDRRIIGCLGAILVPVISVLGAILSTQLFGEREIVGGLVIVAVASIPIFLGVWLWNWGKIAEHEAASKYAEMDNPPEVVYNPQHGLYYFFAFCAIVGGLIGLYFALMNLFGS